jgi:hypothetical protein
MAAIDLSYGMPSAGHAAAIRRAAKQPPGLFDIYRAWNEMNRKYDAESKELQQRYDAAYREKLDNSGLQWEDLVRKYGLVERRGMYGYYDTAVSVLEGTDYTPAMAHAFLYDSRIDGAEYLSATGFFLSAIYNNNPGELIRLDMPIMEELSGLGYRSSNAIVIEVPINGNTGIEHSGIIVNTVEKSDFCLATGITIESTDRKHPNLSSPGEIVIYDNGRDPVCAINESVRYESRRPQSEHEPNYAFVNRRFFPLSDHRFSEAADMVMQLVREARKDISSLSKYTPADLENMKSTIHKAICNSWT